jgi:hypothetical protein
MRFLNYIIKLVCESPEQTYLVHKMSIKKKMPLWLIGWPPTSNPQEAHLINYLCKRPYLIFCWDFLAGRRRNCYFNSP